MSWVWCTKMIVLNNIITIISTIDIKYLVESVLFAKFSRAFLLKKPLVHCYRLDCVWIGVSLFNMKAKATQIKWNCHFEVYFVKYVGRCICEPVSVCILHELFQTDNKSFIHPSTRARSMHFTGYLCFFSKKLFNFIHFFCQSNILYKHTINAHQLHIYENCSICSNLFCISPLRPEYI